MSDRLDSELMEHLSRMRRGSVEISSYAVSHSVLILRVAHPEHVTLELIMQDVQGIWGPVCWPACELAILRDASRKEVIVRDATAGFLAVCGSVAIVSVGD